MTPRKSLLNRLAKYLREITIIVIGILGAFSLNSWGEQVKRKRMEQDIMQQVHLELQNNLTDLENDYSLHRTALFSHFKVDKYINGQTDYRDSLIFDFYWITRDEYIFPNTSGYENLKSIGLDIVQNDTLRSLISIVYNNNFPRLTRGKTLNPDISEYLTPFYKKHFTTNRDTSFKYKFVYGKEKTEIIYPYKLTASDYYFIGYIPLDREALRRNTEFHFLLENVKDFRKYKHRFYFNCIRNVERLMKMIERNYPEVLEDSEE
ncbi:MAG: DUF6090 family protein [Bacteroidota bacterium]